MVFLDVLNMYAVGQVIDPAVSSSFKLQRSVCQILTWQVILNAQFVLLIFFKTLPVCKYTSCQKSNFHTFDFSNDCPFFFEKSRCRKTSV